jgi:hypothetical protein
VQRDRKIPNHVPAYEPADARIIEMPDSAIRSSAGEKKSVTRVDESKEENLAILRPNLLLSLTGTNMTKSCVARTLQHQKKQGGMTS